MRYVRYTIVTLFLLGMVYLAYETVNEYKERQVLIENQKKLQQDAKASLPDLTLPSGEPFGGMPPPPLKSEPKGGGEDLPEKQTAPVAKVKVAGVVEFEISEDNSWQTVYKILAIILGSVLGIRVINTGFNKIERQT